MLVAVQPVGGGQVEIDVRPVVIGAEGEAPRERVLDGRGEDVGRALDPARELGAGRIGRVREVLLHRERQPAGEVQRELAEQEDVRRVLLVHVQEVEELGAHAEVEAVRAQRQLEHDSGDRLDDEVVFGVAGRLEDVRLVLGALGDEGRDLEPRKVEVGGDGVHVDGRRRRDPESQRRAERQECNKQDTGRPPSSHVVSKAPRPR